MGRWWHQNFVGKSIAAIAIVIIILIILVILSKYTSTVVLGGAIVRNKNVAPKEIIVDTLNLTHWLHTGELGKKVPLTIDHIVATIDTSAPILKQKYPGRIMYVVKDRESTLNTEEIRSKLQNAAKRNDVHVYVVERYEKESSRKSAHVHSAFGRDDLYMGFLARGCRCPVLTEDRFRDFDTLRRDVNPFHVTKFMFWKEGSPEKDYINPLSANFRTLKKPRAVRYDTVFPNMQGTLSSSF